MVDRQPQIIWMENRFEYQLFQNWNYLAREVFVVLRKMKLTCYWKVALLLK